MSDLRKACCLIWTDPEDCDPPHTLDMGKNDRCSKTEKSCWRCGNPPIRRPNETDCIDVSLGADRHYH